MDWFLLLTYHGCFVNLIVWIFTAKGSIVPSRLPAAQSAIHRSTEKRRETLSIELRGSMKPRRNRGSLHIPEGH